MQDSGSSSSIELSSAKFLCSSNIVSKLEFSVLLFSCLQQLHHIAHIDASKTALRLNHPIHSSGHCILHLDIVYVRPLT